MLDISSQLGASWRIVGLRLGLPKTVIDMIDHDEHKLQDKCDGECTCQILFIKVAHIRFLTLSSTFTLMDHYYQSLNDITFIVASNKCPVIDEQGLKLFF